MQIDKKKAIFIADSIVPHNLVEEESHDSKIYRIIRRWLHQPRSCSGIDIFCQKIYILVSTPMFMKNLSNFSLMAWEKCKLRISTRVKLSIPHAILAKLEANKTALCIIKMNRMILDLNGTEILCRMTKKRMAKYGIKIRTSFDLKYVSCPFITRLWRPFKTNRKIIIRMDSSVFNRSEKIMIIRIWAMSDTLSSMVVKAATAVTTIESTTNW